MRAQVDILARIPAFRRYLGQAVACVIGGVVHQHIDGAKSIHRLGYGGLKGGDIGDIALDEQRRIAVFRGHIRHKCAGIRALDKRYRCALRKETLAQ